MEMAGKTIIDLGEYFMFVGVIWAFDSRRSTRKTRGDRK